MNRVISQDDVIYFVMTDRFFGRDKHSVETADTAIHGGTLDGIVEKLDYLLELGVTAIWITPVYENIAEHNGSEPYHYYWPKNFDRLDRRLLDGSHLPTSTDPSTLRAFVDTCEGRGMKVILDMVVNHCGYGAAGGFEANWINREVPADHPDHEVKLHLAGLPDFNHDRPDVLDHFIRNVVLWIREGNVANIRMDTVKHVEKAFWHYFKSQIRGEAPGLGLIGEVLSEQPSDIPELQGYQNYHDFDALFDFPLATALRQTLIHDQSPRHWLARPRLHPDEPRGVLDRDNAMSGGYRNANQLVTLLDNHDLQQRIMSHARGKHTGDGEGLQWAVRVCKLCLGALFTMRGVPQLYYGTELGLEGWKQGSNDSDLRRDFPWQIIGPDHRPTADHAVAHEIYHWTRDLIALRKGCDALKYGATITLWSDDLVYAYLRVAFDDVALVIINNGYHDMPHPLPIRLNPDVLPPRVVSSIKGGLAHWQTGESLAVDGDVAGAAVPGKSIAVYRQT